MPLPTPVGVRAEVTADNTSIRVSWECHVRLQPYIRALSTSQTYQSNLILSPCGVFHTALEQAKASTHQIPFTQFPLYIVWACTPSMHSTLSLQAEFAVRH